LELPVDDCAPDFVFSADAAFAFARLGITAGSATAAEAFLMNSLRFMM
jgi:hypothetical protein